MPDEFQELSWLMLNRLRKPAPATAGVVSAVFIPPAPAPLVAPRNIVPAGERRVLRKVCACRHSVADAPPPDGAGAGGCLSCGAGLLSRGMEVKRAVPLLQNERQKNEHDGKSHLDRMPRSRSAAHQSNHQAD